MAFLSSLPCSGTMLRPSAPSRRPCVHAQAMGDLRPSGLRFAGEAPRPGSPAADLVAYATGGPEGPTRPGGRGGEGRQGAGPMGEASASNMAASFRVTVDRPAGGASRLATGGGDDGPGSPSNNGTGGGGNHGNSGGSGGFDPMSLMPWILIYAALAGVAYVGQSISKPKVAVAAAAPAPASSTAVKPCCAGKAK